MQEERVCSPLLWIAYIRCMHLELTDEQTEALIRELSQIIDGDRYPLSPRIVALKEILGMLRPEPARPDRCPRDGIPSRRARDGMHGDEVSLRLATCGDKPCGASLLFSLAFSLLSLALAL
jgi:hypothetical protein